MADRPDPHTASVPEAGQARRKPSEEERLASKLPLPETDQPDPMLQLSVGRLGAGSVTLAAAFGAIILGVVLYGLNSPAPNPQDVAGTKSAPAAPDAGGKLGPAAPSGQSTGNTGHN
ncbi:MAG TPA: hypothetical protein VMF12_00050 [Xanthobacteraceae bacterium]|nr:hypothetical protein [Xanthobacteraceae bacterium]